MKYNFIEIGTSDFNTLIENSNNEVGLSIEPIKFYLDRLPNKINVTKINRAVSNKNGEIEVYYIPLIEIEKNGLSDWFRGCNKIGDYHPLHISHNLKHLVEIDTVDVISVEDLYKEYNIEEIDFLKIDTEGHDIIILNSFIDIFEKNINFYPKRIIFESNSNINSSDIDKVINRLIDLGYILIQRNEDTELIYK
jgi:FkbM family methyltransferase